MFKVSRLWLRGKYRYQNILSNRVSNLKQQLLRQVHGRPNGFELQDCWLSDLDLQDGRQHLVEDNPGQAGCGRVVHFARANWFTSVCQFYHHIVRFKFSQGVSSTVVVAVLCISQTDFWWLIIATLLQSLTCVSSVLCRKPSRHYQDLRAVASQPKGPSIVSTSDSSKYQFQQSSLARWRQETQSKWCKTTKHEI